MKNGKTVLKVSEDIILRLPDPAFALDLYNLVDHQRQHLRKWLSWVDKTTSPEFTRDFLKSSSVFNAGGQQLNTFIFKDDMIIGSLAFVKINKEHHTAEIGYWLQKELQGQGIITRSCRRLINYAFKNMVINRIEMKIAKGNERSIAIPKRLGFLNEATLRDALFLYGKYYDLELFSLLKRDWQMD